MSHTIFVAAMTAVVSAAFGLIFGALLTSSANYTSCLEKGLSVELCKEIRR